MSESQLEVSWEQARDNLGLELIIPFSLDLGSDGKIEAELLVKVLAIEMECW